MEANRIDRCAVEQSVSGTSGQTLGRPRQSIRLPLSDDVSIKDELHATDSMTDSNTMLMSRFTDEG